MKIPAAAMHREDALEVEFHQFGNHLTQIVVGRSQAETPSKSMICSNRNLFSSSPRKRGPEPAPGLNRGHRSSLAWVPAFAGTTISFDPIEF
jgi:hypothetical protein